MGSMGNHESPLYRHAHFMIITWSLGQVIVKSAHWHTDSCCFLLGCSLPCYDLSISFMLTTVPVRVSGQYLSLFCVVNWFPIINIYIHLHKTSIFAHSNVDKSIKYLTNLPLRYIFNTRTIMRLIAINYGLSWTIAIQYFTQLTALMNI